MSNLGRIVSEEKERIGKIVGLHRQTEIENELMTNLS